LDPLSLLVPDGTDHQLVFGDAKGPFRIRQLDVPFPQRSRIQAVKFVRNR